MESLEVAEKVKKLYRDRQGVVTEQFSKELVKELGDVLWYVSVMAKELGYSLEDLANINLQKIQSRKERGCLSGEGDNR